MPRRGEHPSEATLAKMRRVRPSAETRAKMSAAHRLLKLSPEHRANIGAAGMGAKNGNWKGGRIIHSHGGYICLLRPEHPFADSKGYVREHRLVMESHLGRTLLPAEVVHHINGKVDDNRIENLMRFGSQSDHRTWRAGQDEVKDDL